MSRVVVTGMGCITSLGLGVEASWDSLKNSNSGIRAIPENMFDVSDIPATIAGFVPEDSYNLEDFVSNKEAKRMDRFIQLALVAAQEAVSDSGWTPTTEEDKYSTGVLVGSGIGGLISIDNNSRILAEKGARRISPFFIPSCLINLISGHISIKYGYKGPNHSVVTACATSTHAIGDAARLIASGDAKVMVAGGSEAAVCRLGLAGFAAAKTLSTKYNETPEKASRPWDKGRDGFVMGEGAAILVLEDYEHAKARGAKIYGEVSGYGLSGDAYHITSPAEDGDGAFRAMQMAMHKAGVNADQIDYINAHGTSTPVGDMIELRAIKRIVGGNSQISVSSTKSSIGHLLGAAGGIEAVFCLKAMENGIVPPTLNLDDPEDECKGIDLVPHTAKEKKLNIVMSNSFGFGGTNATLIFKKV
jgi:3-oxoacyl-[acyl-carrier-protein] synthase II